MKFEYSFNCDIKFEDNSNSYKTPEEISSVAEKYLKSIILEHFVCNSDTEVNINRKYLKIDDIEYTKG